MKNILHHLIIRLTAFVMLAGMVSCLDKYPQSAIPEDESLQTYSDAEQHLIGIYASMLNSNLYSGLLTLLPDIQTDLVYAVEGFSNTYGNFWQWTVRSTDAEIKGVYEALYQVIGNCNFFLDRIDNVIANESDDTKIDDLEDYKGQVYTIRALCYSELIKCYCKAYDPATAQTELGVVLRTKYFEKEPSVRASLYDSYRFVTDDLERALKLLSDKDEDNVANAEFINWATAHALRARVALYMQDWEAAIKHSSVLIDDMKSLYQLASAKETASDGADKFSHMWAYDQGPEVIWRVGFTTSAYGSPLGTPFLGFRRDYTYFYPDFVPATWALNAYEDSDTRYSAYFAGKDSGINIGTPQGLEWPLLVKYYGNRSLMNTSYTTFMHVTMPKPFRLAEQYLIRAEAYCRKDAPDFSAASKDLGTLRASRFSSGGTLNVSEENWKTQLSEERMRELYMEGFRLQDLKRWGMGFERKPQTSTLREGSSLKVKADNPLFVWPIPQHELEVPGSQVLPNESNK